jgi:hypothetical protein
LNPRKIIAVLCPCCRKPLYRTIATGGAHGKAMPAGDATNPSIDHDRNGEFVKCPHCSLRIAMTRVAEDDHGPKWAIHKIQKCDCRMA